MRLAIFTFQQKIFCKILYKTSKKFLRLFSNADCLKQNFLMHFWSLFFNESAWNLDAWSLKWKYVKWYFLFFCQCYRTWVSAYRFFNVSLFHDFYPKIDSNAYFNSVFSIIGWFNRKMVNAVWFFIIKIRISIIFMHLWSISRLTKFSTTVYTSICHNFHYSTRTITGDYFWNQDIHLKSQLKEY